MTTAERLVAGPSVSDSPPTSSRIPLPSPDPALPGLATVLDPDAMRALIAAATRRFGGVPLDILECRPTYVRYKPGTSCVVLYEATFRDADREWSLPLQLRIGRAGKASEMASRSAFRRLLERSAERHPAPPQPRAFVVPDVDGLIQWYPVDRRLPDLDLAASPAEASTLLGTAVDRVELVRYRPARKALVRWVPADPSLGAVWVTVTGDGRAARAHALLAPLREAGVGVPIPVPLAAEFSGSGQREVTGRPLAELDATELRHVLPAVAELLAALHRVPLPKPASRLPSAYAAEADRVAAAARIVAALLPDAVGATVRRLGQRIASALAALERPTALIHGDFDHDQVVVDGGGPVLLDLDVLRRGDVRVDLGNALAHLPDDEARDALLEGYASTGRLRARRLPLFEAAALLELAVRPFRRLEPDWPQRVEALVERSARRMAALDGPRWKRSGWASAGPAGNGSILALIDRTPATDHLAAAPPTDPTLPTLDRLLDPQVVGPRLSAALERPIEITGVTVVRHKLGRRCTLRYDLGGSAGPPERVFAKTYASERGATVDAVLRALAAGGLPAGSPTLPAPVAWLPDLRASVQREVPGVSVTPLLLVGDREVATLVADAVAHLHESAVVLPRAHEPRDELAPLERAVARLAEASPDLAPIAARTFAGAERRLADPPVWRRRPIHRDLYHDQVLVGSHGISFVDLDDAALSEPAVDVANFLAHLRLLALQDGAAAYPLEDVRDAFLARSISLDPGLDLELVGWLEAATLLRLAAIHRPRARGVEIATALLETAEPMLAGDPVRR